MILSFSSPRFEVLIKAGVKIHTIREDKHDRWKPDMRIHHWMYNPRNVSKNPYAFSHPGTDILISKQKIAIEPEFKLVVVDGFKQLNADELKLLAINDGLTNIRNFFRWFNKPFSGYILHWTNLKY